jgi:hypothetical protein
LAVTDRKARYREQADRSLLALAAILILFRPIVGVYFWVHPAILPFMGIAWDLLQREQPPI